MKSTALLPTENNTSNIRKMQLFQCLRNNLLLSNVIKYDKKSKIANEQRAGMIGKGWARREPFKRGLYPGWIASAGLVEFDSTIPWPYIQSLMKALSPSHAYIHMYGRRGLYSRSHLIPPFCQTQKMNQEVRKTHIKGSLVLPFWGFVSRTHYQQHHWVFGPDLPTPLQAPLSQCRAACWLIRAGIQQKRLLERKHVAVINAAVTMQLCQCVSFTL